MTINEVLLKSILAMDAYNRGGGAGITVTSSKIGDAVFTGGAEDNTIVFYAARYV